ncbi:MAG TPA: ATP-binding protein [Mycobacteriales bacterium]
MDLLPHSRQDGSSPALESRCALPLGVHAVAEARRFVERALGRWERDDDGTVALVVSELVTNAVLYGHGASTVLLRLGCDRLTVEVSDRSATVPTTRPTTDDAEIGRGMHIIEAASLRWGVRAQGEGKVVWCDLPLAGG